MGPLVCAMWMLSVLHNAMLLTLYSSLQGQALAFAEVAGLARQYTSQLRATGDVVWSHADAAKKWWGLSERCLCVCVWGGGAEEGVMRGIHISWGLRH